MKTLVLVTRPFVQAREFATEIENVGFSTLIQPLLTIKKIPFLLHDLQKPDAIFVTSRHALGDTLPLKIGSIFLYLQLGQQPKKLRVMQSLLKFIRGKQM